MTTKLTHFTESADAVKNILEHGFAWMRNDREVIRYFLPRVVVPEKFEFGGLADISLVRRTQR